MKILITLFCILLSFNAFSKTDPKEAYEKVLKGEAILIDVREKDEVKEGMIKNSVWFPLSRFTESETWKKDFKSLILGKDIYLYCRSGRRSEKVRKILKDHKIESTNLGGYEDLKEILPSSNFK